MPIDLTPVEHIAYFSWDAPYDTIRYDLSNLGKFGKPALDAYLLEGRDAFLKFNRTNRVVGHPRPLSHVVQACQAMGSGQDVKDADVVTWRGVLKDLMVGRQTQLRFSFEHGTLYLNQVDRYMHKVLRGQLHSGYHGYTFENLCDEEVEAIPSLYEWVCVCSRSLGDLRLVFGAEVDCVNGEYDGTSRRLVELKTRSRLRRFGRRKRLWFVQSYLAGVPNLYVGLRNSAFQLKEATWVPLGDLLPSQDIMHMMHTRLYSILFDLRAFCLSRAHISATAPREVWTVVAKNGTVTRPVFEGYSSILKPQATHGQIHCPTRHSSDTTERQFVQPPMTPAVIKGRVHQ